MTKRRRQQLAFIDFFNSFINQLRLKAFGGPLTLLAPSLTKTIQSAPSFNQRLTDCRASWIALFVRSLSSSIHSLHQLFFFSFALFSRSVAAAAAPNPLKERRREELSSFIPEERAAPFVSLIPPPAFNEMKFHQIKQVDWFHLFHFRVEPHCPSILLSFLWVAH